MHAVGSGRDATRSCDESGDQAKPAPLPRPIAKLPACAAKLKAPKVELVRAFSFEGDKGPLGEQTAELDKRTQKIEDWLAELGSGGKGKAGKPGKKKK